MRLVHLTDLHVRPPGVLAYGVADTNRLVERALDAVARLRPTPDAIVVTGDLADCGLEAEYGLLARMLQSTIDRMSIARASDQDGSAEATVNPIVLVIPGNHDRREGFLSHLPQARAEDGFIQSAIDLGPMRLVLLDTVVPGAGHGALCDARLDWLDRTLAASPERPTWIAMHHPPIQTGIPVMDAIALRDPARLASVLRRHRQVGGIICGHVHRAIVGSLAGVPVLIGPSVSYATEFALDGAPRDTLMMEPPQFLMHCFADDGAATTHSVFVDTWAGPYPCVGDADYPGRAATQTPLVR